MATTRRTILGVFTEPAQAEQAIAALQTAGFSSDQIHGAKQHASGGFMAGIKSFFSGEETTHDTNVSDFSGMGISDEEARYYENESQTGHRVIAVQANGREQEARDILSANGASTYSKKRSATQTIAKTTPSAGTLQTSKKGKNTRTARAEINKVANSNEERVLRLREEQLNVSKQRVQTGEVNLHKEVVTEQRTIDVPVMHEEAFIERYPVTDATPVDTTPIGEGETIRVPLSEERVNISKNTVESGEVSLEKRAVKGTKQVRGTVRREEVHVEQEGDAPIHGTKSDRFHPDSVDKNPL